MEPKRKNLDNRLRNQTDQNFNENKMRKLTKKSNVAMFKTSTHGGKAFAARQRISDCNGTQTHNHLVRKQTLNHLAKLAK